MKLHTNIKWSLIFMNVFVIVCMGRQQFIPPKGSIPFLVYFSSRHRGLCVGTLVARMAVLTAAVCVVNPQSNVPDTRPVTVVAGSEYRHTGRGVRVQVVKIILPKLSRDLPKRANQLERSVAMLLLKQQVPNVLAEIPVRAISVDYKAEQPPRLQEECYVPGWHFFGLGDKIYTGNKFLLQRSLHVQALNIVKMKEWCQALSLKYQKALALVGFDGFIDENSMVCVRDTDETAQPCHGMYGAPLLCDGRAVGMMTAPDAQWRNCTGFTVVMHLFASAYLRPFFDCVNGLFEMDFLVDSEKMKRDMYQDPTGDYDYAKVVYAPLDASASFDSYEDLRRHHL